MPDAIAGLATSVAAKAFPGLISELTKKVLRGAKQPLLRTYEDITTNFEPHLRATFIKCTQIKTLLNRDAPVDLLSQYINLAFLSEGKSHDDYAVIENIRKRHRVVISGTAGTGKTIFMKYLWLSLFENSMGRIKDQTKEDFVPNYMLLQEMALTAMRDVGVRNKSVGFSFGGQSKDHNLIHMLRDCIPGSLLPRPARDFWG